MKGDYVANAIAHQDDGDPTPHIKVLRKTEIVDGIKWRLLPKTVETDRHGRHWIPENKVVWIGKEEQ